MSEPTRLPVFLRAWRGGSKARAIIAIATLALAASATAKIGEIPEQIVKRSQRDKDVIGIQAGHFARKPTVEVHFRDGATVTHVFGTNGREIALCLNAPKRVTNDDVVKIQQQYRTTWHGTGTDDGLFSWESASSLFMTAKRYKTYDMLWIFDANRKDEIGGIVEALTSEAPAPTPHPVIDFVPNKPAVTADQKDCLIVATEAHARLKKTNCWSRIAAFTWKDDEESVGHAAVFYQPTEDSNVFMYDKTLGSLDLQTQSHDLTQLTNALNQILRSSNARVQSPRWI